MKEAMFYKKLSKKVVKCTLCARRCTIVSGSRGFCGARENRNGKLWSLVYGKLCAMHVDPIEKKPFYHFWPGSKSLSIATTGCNWRCRGCCNYDISHEGQIYGEEYTPRQVVNLALRQKCQGISYTYTEYTVFFEFAHDTAKIAHKKNLLNTVVTNGYTTPEAIRVAARWLDAATVDFKGSGNARFLREWAQVPDPQPIYDALLEYKKRGIFVEVTNLLVPRLGDDMADVKKLVRWIYDNIGPETPLHFLRFFPAGEMMNMPPTPAETIEKARKLAMEAGIKYVYCGNVPGSKSENTFCPSCKEVVIERAGFSVTRTNLKDSRCANCGEKILLVGKIVKQV